MNISLQNITKYKWTKQENGNSVKLTVLNNISFDTCGNDIHAIIGPSGSGKTTLLRLLNKLESPDEGRIFLDGQDITNIPPRVLRKDVGMVFQVPALFQGSIRENLSFGPRLYNSELTGVELQQLLNIVGLQDIEMSRDVNTLSIGQQQRISFARALANEPKIILLDEPTSALDPSAANKLLDLIKKINHEMEIGIFFVTHVMQHAQRIADSVCLLASGEIIENSPAAQFFQQPKTELGQNFVNGKL